MTSLCLVDQFPTLRILNIDHELDALVLSSCLAKACGYKRHISCAHEDAVGSRDLREFDVVYLAALVGSTPGEKLDILRSMLARMKVGTLVCLRSAYGLRGLLYPVSVKRFETIALRVVG